MLTTINRLAYRRYETIYGYGALLIFVWFPSKCNTFTRLVTICVVVCQPFYILLIHSFIFCCHLFGRFTNRVSFLSRCLSSVYCLLFCFILVSTPHERTFMFFKVIIFANLMPLLSLTSADMKRHVVEYMLSTPLCLFHTHTLRALGCCVVIIFFNALE